jgi:A/G-specific adenine glycosylase
MTEALEKSIKYYDKHGRDLPWRQPEKDNSYSLYKILVSELMLQQTQVDRVIPKYNEFISRFPSAEILAKAKLSEVLQVWSGLGYNRRAKYLHKIATEMLRKRNPWTIEELVALPGVGYNTAAAILTYTYGQVLPFVETNVRTVYLHHVFTDDDVVADSQILSVLAADIEASSLSPRMLMWAIMDYGNFLKRQGVKSARRSAQYKRQTPFQGSRRQLRGKVLRSMLYSPQTIEGLAGELKDDRMLAVIKELENEGLVMMEGSSIKLADS